MSESSAQASPRAGSLLVIFLTVFIDLLGFGMVIPLLPIYADQFTIDESGMVLGLLMASYSAMQFVFSPWWGRLSDRVGRRPVLMVGLAASMLFYTLFGIATVWRSLELLFVARIGAGIAGATIATAQAYIADTTTKEKRSKGMALIGMAFGMGFTFGPLLGFLAVPKISSVEDAQGIAERVLREEPADPRSRLERSYRMVLGGEPSPEELAVLHENLEFFRQRYADPSTRPGGVGSTAAADRAAYTAVAKMLLNNPGPWPGYAAAILSAIALSLAAFRLPESLRPGSDAAAHRSLSLQAWRVALHIPSIPFLLIATFVCVFSFANFETTLSLLVKGSRYAPTAPYEFSWGQVCLTYAFIGLMLALVQGGIVRRLAGRISEGLLAATGAGLQVCGFGLTILAIRQSSVGLLFVALGTVVAGFAFMQPNLQSLLSRRSDPTQQGLILGVGQSVSSLARIFGAGIGIPLLRQGLSVPYLAASVLMTCGMLLVVIAAQTGRDFPHDG